MTEENCNFQQNYNVFGLDDKPCCYLYHKYCDEIDSCYFKRCRRLEQENENLKKEVKQIGSDFIKKGDYSRELEQENKELKNIIKIHDSTKYDYYKLMKENEEWHIKYAGCNTANSAIQEENKKYRSALEEIREIADDTFHCCDDDCGNARKIKLIIDKIKEVLNESK